MRSVTVLDGRVPDNVVTDEELTQDAFASTAVWLPLLPYRFTASDGDRLAEVDPLGHAIDTGGRATPQSQARGHWRTQVLIPTTTGRSRLAGLSDRLLYTFATLSLIYLAGALSTHPYTRASESNFQRASTPNILLIMADDVGVDVLGCYGGESYQTPRLDALAAKGTRFTHCYSMPVCHPTRIALLTGRYPFRWKNPRWGSFPEDAEQLTFAHVLKKAGYATAVAGKWQLCMMRDDLDHAQRLGFDESCLFGWHEGPRYHSPMIYQNGKLREGLEDRYGPDVYVDFLIDFMKRNKDKPFLAYYPMALCHDVTDDLDDPVPFGPEGHYDTYKTMAEAMDVRVGRLLDALQRLGLQENTVVIFTTDNGTPKSYIHSAEKDPDPKKRDRYIRRPVVSIVNGEEVPGGKGNLTNDGTNVPMIAYWPGKTHGGVQKSLVDFSDFLPTLAELAGAELEVGMNIDGKSFATQIQGDPFPSRKWAFAERGGKRWVRTQDWKLYSDGRLFYMKADPAEKRPIPTADRSKEAETAASELQKVMQSLQAG